MKNEVLGLLEELFLDSKSELELQINVLNLIKTIINRKQIESNIK